MTGKLELRGVAKDFRINGRTRRVIDALDLQVAPGEFICVVGASGSGKSTLLSLIAGLSLPTEGEILLDLEGERRKLTTGGVVVVPRGVPHAFMVTSSQTRFLTIQTPGTDEAFYRLASEPAPEGSQPIPVDFDRIRDAALQTGAIEIVGPPPF